MLLLKTEQNRTLKQRLKRSIRRCIPTSVFHSLVSALVLSMLGYCNSLLIDLPLTHIQRLQSVQNATARLISNLRRWSSKMSSFTCVADMPHRRRLRSASTEQLDVPTCRQSTVGGRAFPVAGAKVWNGLPSEVTSASSLSVFKNRLKTYLFRRCYKTV